MFSIAALFPMSAKDEEYVFMVMVQFMGRFQYKTMLARLFSHVLYLLEELKPFMEHFIPEPPDDMEV